MCDLSSGYIFLHYWRVYHFATPRLYSVKELLQIYEKYFISANIFDIKRNLFKRVLNRVPRIPFWNFTATKRKCLEQKYMCADGGTRTHTPFRARHPKCRMSTYSITSACPSLRGGRLPPNCF